MVHPNPTNKKHLYNIQSHATNHRNRIIHRRQSNPTTHTHRNTQPRRYTHRIRGTMISKETIIIKLQKNATHIKRDKNGKPIKLTYNKETITLNINDTKITFTNLLTINLHYNPHSLTLTINTLTEEYITSTKINLKEEKTHKFHIKKKKK